jgi:hypothetical protein
MSFPHMTALSWRATGVEYAATPVLDVGQLGMTSDGSLWRLCKAGEALTIQTRAKCNAYEHLEGVTGDSVETSIETAIVAGDMSFTIDDATNAWAKDYFKGGYMIEPRTTGDGPIRVSGSSAEASDVYTIYLERPFTLADAVDNTIHVYPSPWNNVKMANGSDVGDGSYEHFVCVPAFGAITSGYYFWGHVKGAHWMSQTGSWPGAAVMDRQCCFHSNGTIIVVNDKWPSFSNQIAGYLMYSGNYGDTLIYLQIE